VAAVKTAVMLSALFGFVSLGVDYGRVQLAKGELQQIAEASARAAVVGLGTSVSQARADAKAVAFANTVDGSPLVLTDADIELGTWNEQNRTFTVLSGAAEATANAVRVTARRAGSRGTAVPLLFAKVVGKTTQDVSSSAIVMAAPDDENAVGFVGLDGVVMSGNASTNSYESAEEPSQVKKETKRKRRRSRQSSSTQTEIVGSGIGGVASNQSITISGNVKINGDARPGPTGSFSKSGNASVSGSTAKLSANMVFPAVNPGNAATVNNNASIASKFLNANGDLSVSGNNTLNLAAGVYYFKTMSVSGNASLNVNGQVTIYVQQSVSLSGNFYTANNKPSNFKVRVLNNGGSVSLSGNSNLHVDLYAPTAHVTISGNGSFYGQIVGRTLTSNGNGKLYYDTTLPWQGTVVSSSGVGSGPGELVR